MILLEAQIHTMDQTLPDGTRVNLNQSSTLRYPQKFTENERAVELEGEAFFQVEKGSRFEVETPLGKVEVLGTSFNVKARDGDLRVECHSGKVRVSDAQGQEMAILNPGDFVNKAAKGAPETGSFALEQEDWRTGLVAFRNQPFPEVISSMERQLGIEVTYPDSLKSRRYNGSLKKDNPELTYEAISVLYGLEWKKEGDNQIIFY